MFAFTLFLLHTLVRLTIPLTALCSTNSFSFGYLLLGLNNPSTVFFTSPYPVSINFSKLQIFFSIYVCEWLDCVRCSYQQTIDQSLLQLRQTSGSRKRIGIRICIIRMTAYTITIICNYGNLWNVDAIQTLAGAWVYCGCRNELAFKSFGSAPSLTGFQLQLRRSWRSRFFYSRKCTVSGTDRARSPPSTDHITVTKARLKLKIPVSCELWLLKMTSQTRKEARSHKAHFESFIWPIIVVRRGPRHHTILSEWRQTPQCLWRNKECPLEVNGVYACVCMCNGCTTQRKPSLMSQLLPCVALSCSVRGHKGHLYICVCVYVYVREKSHPPPCRCCPQAHIHPNPVCVCMYVQIVNGRKAMQYERLPALVASILSG